MHQDLWTLRQYPPFSSFLRVLLIIWQTGLCGWVGILVPLGNGAGKRVQCCQSVDNVSLSSESRPLALHILTGRKILEWGSHTTMGADFDVLGADTFPLPTRSFGVWRSGILAFLNQVSPIVALFFCARNQLTIKLLRVISITFFFIIAIAISSGGIGDQKIGFKYWQDPGAFADGVNGVCKIFVIAGKSPSQTPA